MESKRMKAAIVRNKALVSPSDCQIHPKYQATRPPTSQAEGCVCQQIYDVTLSSQPIMYFQRDPGDET